MFCFSFFPTLIRTMKLIDNEPITVNVFTGGYRNLGMRITRNMANDVLRTEVQKVVNEFHEYRKAPIHFAYNCVGEDDISKDDVLHRHWGENWKIMEKLIDTETIYGVIWDLRSNYYTFRSKGYKVMNVAFWCRGGKHRSVACALLARWVLEEAGCKVGFVRHLCKHMWPKNFCTTCPDCGEQAAEKRQRFKEQVLDYWHDA